MSSRSHLWFRDATIPPITTNQWPTPDHVHWPLRNVDRSVASSRSSAAFPLVSRSAPDTGQTT